MDKYERRRQRLLFLKKQFCQNKISLLADRLDRPHSYVSRMLYPEGKAHKRRIGDDMLEHIAHMFDVSKAWVDGLEAATLTSTVRFRFGDEQVDTTIQPSPWLKSIEVSSAQAYDQLGLSHHDDVCLMVPCDDSMAPTIPKQSMVLMDHTVHRFIGDGVYCLRFGDLMTFRRLQHGPNGDIRVTTDNDVYAQGAFNYHPKASVPWVICGKLFKVLPLQFIDV